MKAGTIGAGDVWKPAGESMEQQAVYRAVRSVAVFDLTLLDVVLGRQSTTSSLGCDNDEDISA